MQDYAVFDLETTGFDAELDRITEIGWLVVRDGVPGEARSLLVWDGKVVPAEVAEKTGISTRLIAAEGVAPDEALRTFFAEVGDRLPLVGHNVIRFDSRFLMAACRRAGMDHPDVTRYIDTAALFKGRCLGWRPHPAENHARFAFRVLEHRSRHKYNLAHACAELGIDVSDLTAHRAGADVVMTYRLYQALLAEAVPA